MLKEFPRFYRTNERNKRNMDSGDSIEGDEDGLPGIDLDSMYEELDKIIDEAMENP